MSDNRIISANDVILPDDIVNYINSNIKKNWTGVSASWKASKAHIKSFNDKDFRKVGILTSNLIMHARRLHLELQSYDLALM